ncbi:MAG: choice-of-anchor Q domain-containing protein, partial [Paludibacter sp.]
GTITLKNGVSLYGGFAGTEAVLTDRLKGANAWNFTSSTTIDGNNANRKGIITGTGTTTSYIDGITVTKYKITGVAANVNGVGVVVNSYWIMQNCIVTANTLSSSGSYICKGAGVYIQGGQLLNSYINNNSVTRGSGANGAVIAGGVAFVYNSSPVTTVKGCTIETNTSLYGGGMAMIDGTGGVLEDCIFKTNTATFAGGGLGSYLANTTGANGSLSLKNCQFIDNTATTNGGGATLDLSVTAPASTTIDGCIFSGNTTLAIGGGLNAKGIFSSIKNSIFRDNKITTAANTSDAVSALYFYGSGTSGSVGTTLSNCIFVNNSTTTNSSGNNTIKFPNPGNNLYNCTIANNANPGGYALAYSGKVGIMTNCIFWGNTGAGPIQGVTTAVVATYNATDNVVINGAAGSGNNIKTLTTSPNNTFTSPTGFAGVSTDATTKSQVASADWSLKSGCPAINTGTDLSGSGVTTDILGNARPTGINAVDRGAYEGLFVSSTQNVSGFATNSTINVSSGGHLTIDATKTLKNLIVEAGGKLTNSSTLTATSIMLKSDATGSGTFIDNGTTNLTTATIQQYLTGSTLNTAPNGRFWYVANPLTSAVKSSVFDAAAVANKLWYYSEPTHAYTEITDNTTDLTVGVGYAARLGANTTVTLSGTGFYTGSKTFTLSRANDSNEKRGYNLIGNPYPCYLDWQTITLPTEVMPSIWTRSCSAGGAMGFDTYNSSLALGARGVSSVGHANVTQYIAPLQAFWVKVASGYTTASLTVANTLRSHTDVTDVTNKLKAPAEQTQKVVRLLVTNDTNSDETVIAFNTNASNDFDNYDSPKMTNDNVAIPELYTLAGTEILAINGLNNYTLDEQMPLGFTTGASNNFTIKATDIRNFDADTKIILKDNVLNTEQELTVG